MPESTEKIERNRRLGKWINENALIRLYGVLEHHKILGPHKIQGRIDHSLPGWKEVDLMRRMRDAFSKTKLKYRPSDPKNIRLRKEVIEHFALNPNDFLEEEIPTPIDTVVARIFQQCFVYVLAKCSAHNQRLKSTPYPSASRPAGAT